MRCFNFFLKGYFGRGDKVVFNELNTNIINNLKIKTIMQI